MRTLYISDLDGTLMQPDATVSPHSVELLNASIAEKKLFSVATARTPATVGPILERVNVSLPLVVITGAALWNPHTHVYSDVRKIGIEQVRKLLNIYSDTDTSSFLFTLEKDVIDIYHLNGALTDLQCRFYEERKGSPYKCFHLDPAGTTTLPTDLSQTILFYTFIPDAHARATFELIRDIPGVKAQYYHDIYGPEIGILEAFAGTATKANAVMTLKEKVGADRVVCFGDNINDLPMMKVADLAVAVENALPEVKEAADIVIGPNTEDSVAKFIYDE